MTGPIDVFAGWYQAKPVQLGSLDATARTGGGESFSFEYDGAWLALRDRASIVLDPRLAPFSGRQYPARDDVTFGAFADASPDRWGRTLMRRRLARDQRLGLAPPDARLRESDYLLGVQDVSRLGALRFRTESDGPFLDDRSRDPAPPFIRLRELEAASSAFERDETHPTSDDEEWLRILLAPGGSLGGARPKASVTDLDGRLWIAKFPSIGDRADVGAWEFVVANLARACGLRVPRCKARAFASPSHTFLVERFDRAESGARIHFASAMTLTGRRDGDDASTGASYLDIAEVITRYGARPNEDLRELWSRVLFNVLVSNTDDHLRNHGFLLEPEVGWYLSGAYDMNPVPSSDGLRLNIDDADNALDLDLVRSVAGYFRIPKRDVDPSISRFRDVVRTWRTAASHLGISSREQDEMAPAFRIAASR